MFCSVIGFKVGSFGTSHEFGNGSNSSNLFPSNALGTTNLPNLPTNGSGFGGSASNIYGASLSSSIVSSPIFSGKCRAIHIPCLDFQYNCVDYINPRM